MSAVVLSGVSVDYGDGPVLRDIDLEVRRLEIHVLLGPSGSGKTTLLRAIAGFEAVAGGTIEMAQVRVDGGGHWKPPELRNTGVVFQDYALFGHLDVAGNVAFGMHNATPDAVRALLEKVGLTGYGARDVSTLSGGEQQRVALARALAQQPSLLLLDEPFSNLNRELRRELRSATRDVLRAEALTAVFVTHDAEEAFWLADRMSVLVEGRLLQTGTPANLYDAPESLAVARSLGDASLLPVDENDHTPLGRVDIAGGTGDHIVVRPEWIQVGSGVEAQVLEQRRLGSVTELKLALAGHTILARVTPQHIENTVEIHLSHATVRVEGLPHDIDN